MGWNVQYGPIACRRPSKRGVKGDVWFSLIDKVHRPKVLLDGWIRRRLRTILRGYHKGIGITRARKTSDGRTRTFRTLGILAFTMPIVLYAGPHEVKLPTGEPDAKDPLVRFGGGRTWATKFSHPYIR